MEILKVKNLQKSFGAKKVLDGVSFTLEAGESLGVVGQSGSGKSTLAKIISRLIDFDGGEIFFCGEEFSTLPNKKIYRNLQMIFQMPEDSFNPRQTLGWSIAEPLKNFGAKNISERVKNLLNEVDLPKDFSTRYPHEVSGGQCQRAAIARAISISPKLLLCDEATSALDVEVQAQIVKLLRRLNVEKKIALIFITHDLSLLPKIADKVIVLHGGKIIETGSPTEIIDKPQADFTKKLLAANFFTTNGGA